jgi:hypothetical protein
MKAEVFYRWGYTRIGMPDRYTLRMLATELWALTENDWGIFPKPPILTRADGTIQHETFETAAEFHQTFLDSLGDYEFPPKVLVGTPRGSVIENHADQVCLLQYFAHAGQPMDVGAAFSVDGYQVEYWFSGTIDPQPDEDYENYGRIFIR